MQQPGLFRDPGNTSQTSVKWCDVCSRATHKHPRNSPLTNHWAHGLAPRRGLAAGRATPQSAPHLLGAPDTDPSPNCLASLNSGHMLLFLLVLLLLSVGSWRVSSLRTLREAQALMSFTDNRLLSVLKVKVNVKTAQPETLENSGQRGREAVCSKARPSRWFFTKLYPLLQKWTSEPHVGARTRERVM